MKPHKKTDKEASITSGNFFDLSMKPIERRIKGKHEDGIVPVDLFSKRAEIDASRAENHLGKIFMN